MSSLQNVMSAVPALRDVLPVDSLNALSEVCRDLNASTRLSGSYLHHYRKVSDSLSPLMHATYPCTRKKPAADYKRALRGMWVHYARQSPAPPPMTEADLKAHLHYLTVALLPGMAEDALDEVACLQSRYAAAALQDWQFWRDTVVAVGVGTAVVAGLFCYSTTAAAAGVLTLLAALLFWLMRPSRS
jgi:hypothetical protein